jgi:hypothetical protein
MTVLTVYTNRGGGAQTTICNNWASRIIGKGADPYGLGRWSYFILQGKGSIKIALITAYQVCSATISSLGPTTYAAQQYRHLSSYLRESSLTTQPNPRRQFILDLQAWIESLVHTNHDIILSLDGNEDYTISTPQFTPLTYIANKHIDNPKHDGTLATLLKTCGLIDPFTSHHSFKKPPPTYSRGKSRIDYIFISNTLLHSTICSGILPYNHPFISDHRPCFVDFNGSLLFQDSTHSIEPPRRRGLQLFDPRKTKQYIDELDTQLEYHNALPKTHRLYQKAPTTSWSHSNIDHYIRLDSTITESMLRTEKVTTRIFSTKYDWSPALSTLLNKERYWTLCLKRSKGIEVSDYRLLKTQAAGNIDPSVLPDPLTRPAIVKMLRETRHDLKENKKVHSELRQTHLAAIAEARIEKRSPDLAHPSNMLKMDEAISREIKQIAQREQRKQMFQIITKVLVPSDTNHSGLIRIDIPASENTQPFPNGPDPKTWTGPWKSITNPEEIATHVCAANRRQYNQACNTPFASKPLLTYFGFGGDTVGADALLAGELPPPQITKSLLPETMQLLTLAKPSVGVPVFSSTISAQEFASLYKILPESTSSSPSGRHLGHYKVASGYDHLAGLHSMMMSIPYLAGFSPPRWQQVVDIMLEKDPGDPKIHRLRIIALQESDFNQSNRLVLARPLTHHLEDKLLIPNMQYGSRPGKHCHSAILNKQLTYEIIRQTKATAAFIENDAIGCYDRMVNPLLILCLRKLGTNRKTAASLVSTWQHTIVLFLPW